MAAPESHSRKPPLLVGPFTQLLPMAGMPLKGALPDRDMPVIKGAGVWIEGNRIRKVGAFDPLLREARALKVAIAELPGPCVGLPGFIDSHTHSCFAGSRARDYALRNSGSTYLEIAEAGGGIWDSVQQTRRASPETLGQLLMERAARFLASGVTTLEVKSGYGLSVSEELKMLRVIQAANAGAATDLVATCLAAHTLPPDFEGSATQYLKMLERELLPVLQKERLTSRLDAFVEQGAFSPAEITPYFMAGKAMGFSLTVHADQFTTGGSQVAIACGALSADHLEASGPKEIEALARSQVIATALPGATLGLGCGFAPARALLDAGACLAIASDYNPGSAPMGDLLTQASLLGAFEKLSNVEVLAGVTFRAAAALGIDDRGTLARGQRADLVVFPVPHYQEILYHQGQLRPSMVWKDGDCVLDKSAD